MNNEKEEWERKFIRRFSQMNCSSPYLIPEILDFIRTQREQARREGYEDVIELLKKYQPLMGQHEQNLLQEAIFSIGSLKAKLNK